MNGLQQAFELLLEMSKQDRARILPTLDLSAEDRRLLGKMLEAEDTSDLLIDTPIPDSIARVAEEVRLSERLIGTTVGNFRLLELIGEGGTAAVYKAQRAAGDGQQLVALKMLQAGVVSTSVARRFGREQAILAQLNHPNIARLVEGGITELGVPYIAMELFEGRPITVAANELGLGKDERLATFITLCRTVDSAHSALIVHCDLKPSNVLLNDAKEVKVLDFGISRLLGGTTKEESTATLWLTPEYAAPEQFRQEYPTVAVDVYALGRMLTELVSGRRSNRSGKPDDIDVVRRLRARDPELFAIIDMACADEPSVRYRSAEALAADVERYVAGEPLAAMPGGVLSRTWKLVGRHRTAFFSTFFVFATLLGALLFSLRQQSIARSEAERANTVRDFVERMFEPVRDGVAEGRQPSLKDLVDAGVSRLNADTRLDPTTRTDLTLLFARLLNNLGERNAAKKLASAATDLSTKTLPDLHPLAIDAIQLKGNLALRSGAVAEGEKDLKEAHRRLVLAGTHGKQLIRVLDALAFAAMEHNDPNHVLELEQQAFDEAVATYGPGAKEAASAYNNLGYGLEAVDRFPEAAEAYANAHQINLRYRDPQSYHVTTELSNLAGALAKAGDLFQAKALLGQARDNFSRLGGRVREMRVINAQRLCGVDVLLFDPSAEAHCDEAIRDANALDSGSDDTLGDSYRWEAVRLVDAGRFAEARHLIASAQEKYKGIDQVSAVNGEVVWLMAEIAWFEGNTLTAQRDSFLAMQSMSSSDLPARLAVAGRFLLTCLDVPNPACNGAQQARVKTQLDAKRNYVPPKILFAELEFARVEWAYGSRRAARARLDRAILDSAAQLGTQHPLIMAARGWLAVMYGMEGDCAAATKQMALVNNSRDLALTYPALREALIAARSVPCAGFYAFGPRYDVTFQ